MNPAKNTIGSWHPWPKINDLHNRSRWNGASLVKPIRCDSCTEPHLSDPKQEVTWTACELGCRGLSFWKMLLFVVRPTKERRGDSYACWEWRSPFLKWKNQRLNGWERISWLKILPLFSLDDAESRSHGALPKPSFYPIFSTNHCYIVDTKRVGNRGIWYVHRKENLISSYLCILILPVLKQSSPCWMRWN